MYNDGYRSAENAGIQEHSIEPFLIEHSEAVAKLHEEGIPTGFLSKCGRKFLKKLYCEISNNPHAKVFVSIDPVSKNVDGFIAGTLNLDRMYRSMILKKTVPFFFLLLPRLSTFTMLKYVLETMLYPYKSKMHTVPGNSHLSIEGNIPMVSEIRAELLSIVVAPHLRKKGVGKKLILVLDSWFQSKNIFDYKVVTSSIDKASKSFYESCGFIQSRIFVHHGNQMCEYFRQLARNDS